MSLGDITRRVSAWFLAKMIMVLSPQRRAYFCMSYLLVMMSQYKRIFVFPTKKHGFRKDDLCVQSQQLSELFGGAGGQSGQPTPPKGPV